MGYGLAAMKDGYRVAGLHQTAHHMAPDETSSADH
jgi:hypothetical protein